VALPEVPHRVDQCEFGFALDLILARLKTRPTPGDIPQHWGTRPVCRLGCFQFERGEAEVPPLINFVIPTAMSTTPGGTKTNAVNQTAKPMPIANTPPASHGQALFTREGYPVGRSRSLPGT
jgi:hypothetical protein